MRRILSAVCWLVVAFAGCVMFLSGLALLPDIERESVPRTPEPTATAATPAPVSVPVPDPTFVPTGTPVDWRWYVPDLYECHESIILMQVKNPMTACQQTSFDAPGSPQ